MIRHMTKRVAAFILAAGAAIAAPAARYADGVSVRELELTEPRQMEAFVVRVDLTTPGIGFTMTERSDRYGEWMPGEKAGAGFTACVKCERTEDFMARRRLEGKNVEVAVNTAPWHPFPPPKGCDYGQPWGWNVADGIEISHNSNPTGALFVVRRDGRAEIVPRGYVDETNDVAFAICGFDAIMTNGVDVASKWRREDEGTHPRTAFGLTSDGKTLVILAVDGRQRGYSEGAEMSDLRSILRGEGVTDAINMDGGGSTAVVVFDREKRLPVMLNRHKNGVVRRDAVNFGITFGNTDAKAECERTASVYHAYEPGDMGDTPPPAGYAPFYVSHFGRHGSRRLTGDYVPDALKALEKAQAADLLSTRGRELLGCVRQIADAHDGMDGMLSLRGASEHRTIAGRMARRFPDAFAVGGLVRCQASTVPRCLMSMANFSCALKDAAPGLSFSFETGDRCRAKMLMNPHGNGYSKKDIRKQIDRFCESELDADALMARIFADPAAADACIGTNRVGFARNLFACASDCQCLSEELGGLDIYSFFTAEETCALARTLDAEWYGIMANSEEFGRSVMWHIARRPIVDDIVSRAEEAIAGGKVVADLRFGHDSGIWPVAGLLGLEGPGDRVPMAKAWKSCPGWKWMPMATNIQMVFYRNGEGDVLVKILYNEQEMRLCGLEPVSGVYYRWSDVKRRLAQPDLEAGNAPNGE